MYVHCLLYNLSYILTVFLRFLCVYDVVVVVVVVVIIDNATFS